MDEDELNNFFTTGGGSGGGGGGGGGITPSPSPTPSPAAASGECDIIAQNCPIGFTCQIVQTGTTGFGLPIISSRCVAIEGPPSPTPSPSKSNGLCTTDRQCASGFYCDTSTVLRYDDNGGGDPYANPVYACRPIPNPSPSPTPSPTPQPLTVTADPKTVQFSRLAEQTLQGAILSKKIGDAGAIWRSSNPAVVTATNTATTPLGSPETGYSVVTQLTATGLGRTTVSVEYQGVSDTIEVTVGTAYRICNETSDRFTFDTLPPTGYQRIADNNCYSPIPRTYTVTAITSDPPTNAKSGTVTIQNTIGNQLRSNPVTVAENTQLTLLATPVSGYRFLYWMGIQPNVQTLGQSVNIAVDRDITAVAVFEKTAVISTPTRITISGKSELFVGETSPYTATVYDQNNNIMQQTVRWSSRRSETATINSSGLVTAVASGTATILAEIDNLSAEKNIIISQTPPTWRICNQTTQNSGTPDLNVYNASSDTTGVCYVVKTTWRICNQTTQNSGNPDLTTYDASSDTTGVCYRLKESTWRTCGTNTRTPGTPPNTYEASTDATGHCYRVKTTESWRDCVTGILNTGTPPSTTHRQVAYSGAGGGTCWEPITSLTFSPSLSDALVFTYQKNSTTFPQAKSITVTNSSYGKTYALSMTTNPNIIITPSAFTISPRSTVTFTVRTTPDLLNELPVGTSTLQLNVNSVES